MFDIDNCTVHTKARNIELQEELFHHHRGLMITLHPYHLNLDPTELVFHTMLERLVSLRARYNTYTEECFFTEIVAEIKSFKLHTCSFFDKCGYNS